MHTMPEYNPQLVRKEEQRLETLSSTGLFWLLITLTLILLAFAVNVFGPRQNGAVAMDPSRTPTPTESHQPRTYTISYRNGVFSPTNLRIRAGDTVRWRNDGLFPIHVISDPHPEHNQVSGLDSVGDIQPGSTYGFTFANKGIFGYHNERNINEVGTIMVR